MLNPFINLLGDIISLINLALIVWVVLGALIYFDVVNRGNPLISRVNEVLTRLLEPMLGRIRRVTSKFLPDLGGIDVSPVILILLLNFLKNALYDWFYHI